MTGQKKKTRRIVTVTQEHIDRATPCDSSYCAIANAVKDSLPYAQRVNVDLQSIRFTHRDTGVRYTYFTPPAGQAYLLALDDGNRAAMQPFKFLLNRPAQTQQPSERRGKATVTKSKTHAPIKRDGKALPLGPLAGSAHQMRTGRIRRFGLRSMGRFTPDGEQ